MTLIKALKAHFNVRATEWLMSLWAILWGAQLLLMPEIFYNPATSQVFETMKYMVSWASAPAPNVWGMAALAVGFIRGSALFINGAWRRTPIIRLATSSLSAFLVVSIFVGVTSQGVANTGTPTYFVLFCMDCLSGYRAAKDLKEADRLLKLYSSA